MEGLERLKARGEQGYNAVALVRDLVLDKIRAEEEYAAKLISIGSKFRKEVENRDDYCEFPPTFTTLIGDIEQMGAARQQLREQMLTEIYLPLEDYLDMKTPLKLDSRMNFVTASLAFRDFEVVRQEFIKETLTKLSIINSINAESEDDIARRFGEDVENFNCEEFIQKLVRLDEPFFPKTEQTVAKRDKTKKGHRVTWSQQLDNVIGISETESKAPVLVAESLADEEAFAEISAITGRQLNVISMSQKEEDKPKEPSKESSQRSKIASSDPLDLMDSFLAVAKATTYIQEADDYEEEKKRKEEEKLQKEKEEKEKEEKEKQAQKVKPALPPKPMLPSYEGDDCFLQPVITETVSCQYLKGQLKRCDLSGQIAFAGTMRKDCRTDFSFDFADKTSIENILPNKSFVQTSPDEGLGFKCNLRALAHYVTPKTPVPALKYRVLGSSVAAKVPILLSVAWKCEPTTTSIIINYRSTAKEKMKLEDFGCHVNVSGGVTSVQAKPSCQWDQATQIASWSFGTVELDPAQPFEGKLLGRFAVQQTSSPAPVSVKFRCEGLLLSDMLFDFSDSSDFKWVAPTKILNAGKYIAL